MTSTGAEAGGLESVVTIGIKHTSNFARRRLMLSILMRSVREHHGPTVAIIVADDGGAPDQTALASFDARYLALPVASGLSHGRNAIVRETRTPFLALMDDDVVFRSPDALATLLEALRGAPRAALAGGCYYDLRFDRRDCFNLRFDVEEGGAVVRAKPAHGAAGPSCFSADVRLASNHA